MRQTHQTTLAIAAVAAVVALGSPLAAQNRCLRIESIADCWDRYFSTDAVTAQEASEEESELREEPTGTDTGGANLATNKKNLLPLFALSGLLGDSVEGGDDGTLVFDLNLPGLEGDDKDFKIQAIVDNEPELAEPVVQALPEATRSEQSAKLLEGLDDLADYRYSVTYNPTRWRFGRGFGQYREHFKVLTGEIVNAATRPNVMQMLVVLADANLDGANPTPTPIDQLTSGGNPLPVAKQLEIVGAVEAEARKLSGREGALTKAMAAAGIDRFHKLVDNQRQLHFSAEKKIRDSLVGGNELSIELTFEWAAVNLNQALGKSCFDDLPRNQNVESCLATYSDYVEDNGSNLDTTNRFSFSGEYVEIDATTADLSSLELDPVTLAESDKLILSAGWGREFAGAGGAPVTVDLKLSYEDVSNDPKRKDRGLATLTFTRKIGQVEVPFGIVYANHGEYLTDVDEKLSAHVGISFSGLGKPKAE